MKKSNKTPKNYLTADAGLIEALDELSQLIDLKNRVKAKQAANQKLNQEEEMYVNLTPQQKETYDRVFNRKKSRFVENYLFPAMANLLTILETVEYGQLRGHFDKDIRKLLLTVNKNDIDKEDAHWREIIKSNKPENQKELREYRLGVGRTLYRLATSKRNIFSRLLDAILLQTESDDFRLLLLSILQHKISKFANNAITPADFKLFNDVGKPDIGRAVSWIDYLSNRALANSIRIKFNPDVRPVLF